MSKVKDVSIQIRGVSYKPKDLHNTLNDNSVILLRANNIIDDSLNIDDVIYVDKSKVSESQYLVKGDILVCASSGSKNLVGKATFIKDDIVATFGAFCKVVRPKEIFPAFLGYYFTSPKYRDTISQLSAGANINNIKNEHIDSLNINIPDTEQQQQIAENLDKVTRAIDLCNTILEKLDLLVKARFVEMFGDPVSNPNNWEKVALGELAEIKIGPFGTLLHKEDYIANGHALVNPSHIIDGKVAIDVKLSVSDEKYTELSAYHLFVDDVIMGRRGEMGRCAVVTESGLLCGTGSLIIRTNGRLKADYIQKIISFPSFKKAVADMAVGQTMPNLNVPIVSNFMIICPPIDVQERYYFFVEQIDKSKLKVKQVLEKAETLKKALMQEYFG